MSFAREPVRAPALTGLAWLNTPTPLNWEALRGKLVLLDFWTYCCINCLHVLEELRAIEAKYAGAPLVVIGVHSAKFNNEQDVAHIRDAIARYDIRHPVIVDDQHRLWNAFAVRGWPTLVLVDHQGYLLGTVSGEGNGPRLDAAIGSALELLRADHALNDAPLPTLLEADAMPLTPLRYPGKVLADPAHDRLFIADSGYHRIVITTLRGQWLATIGAGQAGYVDGAWDAAQFNQPQGLALSGDGTTLYIADSTNHLIRCADLATHTVTTIAGTGQQNHQRFPTGPALATALNSPWDLTLQDATLWIAMAGQHQIWTLNLASQEIVVAAGSTGEGRHDAPGLAAAFAQPSGSVLSGDGHTLYIADSESSCIRAVDLRQPDLPVTTLAGGDLFEFGLRDGVGDAARFQHPLGIAWHAGFLYVADTFNHAIRRIDPHTGDVRTVAGQGEAGMLDGPGLAAHFYEPSGLSAVGNTLYVADTNNHAIRMLDVATGATTTLPLTEVCAPGICLPE